MVTRGLVVSDQVPVCLRGPILQSVVALAHIVVAAVLITAAALAMAMVRGAARRALH